MESDLPKGYRGAAERSSEVGVPEWLSRQRRGETGSTRVGVPELPLSGCPSVPSTSMESDLRKGYRGAAERSSNVGVLEWLCAFKQSGCPGVVNDHPRPPDC